MPARSAKLELSIAEGARPLPLVDKFFSDLSARLGSDRTAPADERLPRCVRDRAYFIHNFCKLKTEGADGGGKWIPFHLWKEQGEVIVTIQNNQLTIILKARQLGMSWLCLAYALHLMLFFPGATVLAFSLREKEAAVLVKRLHGMYDNLPAWVQMRKRIGDDRFEWATREIRTDNETLFELENGSAIRAFSTDAGDSYNASLAIIDEADLVPDLGTLMGRVQPTIDAGGKMILVSRADKSQPNSEFKRIYRSAKKKLNSWAHVFLSWRVHPGRDDAWYAQKLADSINNTGSEDAVWEQYPETDTQALAAKSLDKRISPKWIARPSVYREEDALTDEQLVTQWGGDLSDIPAIPNLRIYRLPKAGLQYVMGCDPAEGNPTSDDSALSVVEVSTGEQVAVLNGKIEMSTMGDYIDQVGKFYNRASVLVERNNHGHAVLQYLDEHSSLMVVKGIDGKRGWVSSQRGKVLLYNACADAIRTEDAIIHDFETKEQLAGIEGSSLRAPKGEMDDVADSFALCMVARTLDLVDEEPDIPGSYGYYEASY